jgi:ribosomal protein S14
MLDFKYLKQKHFSFSLKENKRVIYSFLNEMRKFDSQSIRKLPLKISIKNRCLATNEHTSSFREFRLSRHKFNSFSNQGILVGVKRAI